MNVFASNKVMIAITAPLIVLFLALSLVLTTIDRDTLAETMSTPSPGQTASATEGGERYTAAQKPVTDEVLWLARVIYSETKRPYEQELVAWVVRNRVETRFRGKNTYRQVVLDPWQFSAFNRNTPKRVHYTSLGRNSQAAGWGTAIDIAREVYHAPAYTRPFAKSTRHFYSEQSMVGRRHPTWATGQRPVALDRPIEPRRFRFFANIS